VVNQKMLRIGLKGMNAEYAKSEIVLMDSCYAPLTSSPNCFKASSYLCLSIFPSCPSGILTSHFLIFPDL